jgi:hypothetical protein
VLLPSGQGCFETLGNDGIAGLQDHGKNGSYRFEAGMYFICFDVTRRAPITRHMLDDGQEGLSFARERHLIAQRCYGR